MHTTFCDGKSHPEDYVLVALNKGMESIGFSAHVPISIVNDGEPILNCGNLKTEAETPAASTMKIKI